MIETFRVQNFKALRDVTLNLTPIHLLIGPNDSGKTSLLEAVTALIQTSLVPFHEAFRGRWNGADLVFGRNAKSPVTFSAEFRGTQQLKYELSVQFSSEGRSVRLMDEVIETEHTSHRFNHAPGYSDARSLLGSARNEIKGRLKLFDPHLDAHLAEAVVDHLTSVEIFRWNPHFLALPCSLDSKAGFRMMSSGFGLARVLDAILTYDPMRYVDQLLRTYRQYFPSVQDVKLRPEMGFRARVVQDEFMPVMEGQDGKGIVFRLTSNNVELPAAQMSDGMLLVLAYLAVLYSPEPPRVLLIEEPENGIHPERLREVIGILRELIQCQGRTQVILTSHSPYIVSLFQPEEVTLCRKNSDGYVEVKRLSESKIVQQQLDVFSLGEIWPAEEEAIFEEASEQPTVSETQS